ncbi:hypothetical protein [Chitinophaga pinensis]|uniref:Uncharacterized protein n=1 Tax=Chitinophaga pinensis (strain ATCC 43595 / DSM 2588 / LMG 13176 / NBRC 15968 / NCIMB 11800 / UQM 2034) TaxID=485918 RepID=A0A979G6Q0_CHIPD|nr:hypothetical protein [Chitinophaga pinensis]ACU61884.1 hypothetical protein Cpin_4440 [Chitinophaga pinensis DSM 2588]
MQTDNNKPHAVPATGNASNPSPEQENTPGEGLIDSKGEKYLKEGANIEDMPDPQEDEEAIRELRKED